MAANARLEEFLNNWLTGGRATREAFMLEVSEMLKAERERCAQIVDGWHIKNGGYTELASQIRELH